MGIPMLQAHFFIFFYACYSMVTPPVGMGPLIASKLAGAKYLPTAVEGLKAAMGGFLVPALIIWNPVLLFQPGQPLLQAVLGVITCLAMILGLQVLINNYFINAITLWERILCGISSFALIGYFIMGNYVFFVVGMGLIIFISARQFMTMGQPSKLDLKTPGDGM
jgi:TRAP-type uncharacterized transport system fused permease subunit